MVIGIIDKVCAMILSGDTIKDLIKKGYIFDEKGDFFDEKYLTPAGYEVMIDPTYIGVNGQWLDEEDIGMNDGKIELGPHKYAIVRTKYKLLLPSDICAHVGIRFKYISRGLIGMYGPQIDPGYNDYFYALVYNNSDHSIFINLNDPFFKIEFCKTDRDTGAERRDYNKNPGKYLDLTKIDPFRRTMEDIKKIINRTDELDRKIDEIEKSLNQTVSEIRIIKDNVEDIEKGYQPIIWFGYFIVFSTIFGVIYSALFQSVENIKKPIGVYLLTVIIVINILFLAITLRVFNNIVNSYKSVRETNHNLKEV